MDNTKYHILYYVNVVMCAVQSKKLQAEMLQTAPPSSVHDVAFPYQYSEVFAACGLGEIRIWHLQSRRELLRMSVPNLDCRCVAFMQVSPNKPQHLGIASLPHACDCNSVQLLSNV